MKKNTVHNRLFFLVLMVLSTGCDTKKNSAARIEAEVNAKLAEITAKNHRDCLAIARDSADRIVDNLIFSQNLANDSSKIFIKPVKPVKPVLKSRLDTADVVPIFNSNLKNSKN